MVYRWKFYKINFDINTLEKNNVIFILYLEAKQNSLFRELVYIAETEHVQEHIKE